MKPLRILIVRTERSDDYVESIRRAGVDPVVVDPTGALDLARLVDADGVVLPGGRDVDPHIYGESPDPSFDAAGSGQDAFEIELVTRAIERDLPMLGICRGLQVMNVAAGGTLVQHIPGDIPRALDHQVATSRDAIAHEVTVPADSALARALELTSSGNAVRVRVNSRHHQAVKHVAPGFVPVATADDGVIEALERPASRFCIGVQWHPENFWRTGEFDALFASFVRACGPGASRERG